MHECILYSSVAAADTNMPDVFDIIETSARRNPDRDLTGFLIFDRDRFLQLLEGPSESLDALMQTLKADPRHHSLEVLLRMEVDGRWFSNWQMKRLVSFGSVPALEELRGRLQGQKDGERLLAKVNEFIKG